MFSLAFTAGNGSNLITLSEINIKKNRKSRFSFVSCLLQIEVFEVFLQEELFLSAAFQN